MAGAVAGNCGYVASMLLMRLPWLSTLPLLPPDPVLYRRASLPVLVVRGVEAPDRGGASTVA